MSEASKYIVSKIADKYKVLAIVTRSTIKPTMEEWNAAKIVKVIMEDVEMEWDVSGWSCEI